VAKAEPVPETKPVPTVASAGARPTPLPTSGKRLAGDDLLTELFEAFGDLHFVQDALAGADFVLHLTLQKLPSEVGLVSMFDMNTREFVIVRQSGGPRSAITMRQPEKAPLAISAMRKRHAVVVADAAEAERAMDTRWRAIGVELKSLVCAPIELSGRYLGLIELANPIDGHAFNEGDGNALTYIGQQFAEFVAARGVVVDPAQIRGEEEKPAPPPPSPKSGPKSPKTNPGTKGRS
jgi:GAF domain-containing protein